MKVKKWDKIIIATLLILSFVPYLIFKAFVLQNYNTTFAKIEVDGKLYDRIKLTGHQGIERFEVKTPQGYNIVEVNEEKIAIIEADCPDKTCTQPGFISRPGEALICLPHKLSINIEGTRDDKEDIDIKAY